MARLKTYTVEFEWHIPRLIHQQIEATSAKAAMAEAKRMIAEDDGIEYESSHDVDDGCTDIEISGLWEGEDSYGGPDLRPDVDVAITELSIARHLSPKVAKAAAGPGPERRIVKKARAILLGPQPPAPPAVS